MSNFIPIKKILLCPLKGFFILCMAICRAIVYVLYGGLWSLDHLIIIALDEQTEREREWTILLKKIQNFWANTVFLFDQFSNCYLFRVDEQTERDSEQFISFPSTSLTDSGGHSNTKAQFISFPSTSLTDSGGHSNTKAPCIRALAQRITM